MRVHVIDDDEAVRESLEALLLVEGFDVATHPSAEAFLACADHADGCVIVDVRMPGMGGLGLLELLAGREGAPPVVMLTAGRDERVRERALALGARAFLGKPVTGEALLATLAALVRAGGHQDKS